MTATRQDAWSVEHDTILAEVTMRHIREGSTQLLAFEEVAIRIGRTAAACGFRWNSAVRKQHHEAIQTAKSQRTWHAQTRTVHTRLLLDTPAEEQTSFACEMSEGEGEAIEGLPVGTRLSLDVLIRALRQWKHVHQDGVKQQRMLIKHVREMEIELQRLRQENERLKTNFLAVQQDYQVVNEDYKALIQMMERARKMAFLVPDEHEQPTRFRMDSNGNLERID